MDVKFTSSRNVVWDDSLYTTDQVALTPDYDLGAPESRDWIASSPFIDGENDYGGTMGTREIFLSYILSAADTVSRDALVSTLKTAFNPTDGLGLLTITRADGSLRSIWCKPRGEPVCLSGSGRRSNRQMVQVTLKAPYPFWINPVMKSYTLASFSGGLSFPLTFPMTFGTAVQQITVTNEGNVRTPVIVAFNGEITNPRIDNLTTGKYIAATMSLASGSTLRMNTGQGQHTVEYIHGTTNENGFEYLADESEFFWLEPGDNIISFSSSASIGADASCIVEFYDQYLGAI